MSFSIALLLLLLGQPGVGEASAEPGARYTRVKVFGERYCGCSQKPRDRVYGPYGCVWVCEMTDPFEMEELPDPQKSK